MRNRKWTIFTTFALFFLLKNPFAGAENLTVVSVSGSSPVFRDYYSLLHTNSNQPFKRQIDELLLFIDKHPEFERPYHQLLSIAFLANRIDDVESFLKEKAASEPSYRNCLWTLSQISAARDSSGAALQRLEEALKQPVPTPYLLMEFALRHTLTDLETFVETLNKLGINETDRQIALSFYYSQKGDASVFDHLSQVRDNPAFELYAESIVGYSFLSERNFAAADSVISLGIERAEQLGDQQFQIHFQILSAQLYLLFNEGKKAEHYCQTALSHADAINDLERLASAHILYGQILSQKKQHETALAQIEQARDIYETMHRPVQIALALRHMGIVYSNMLQFSKAIDLYDQSIAIGKKLSDRHILMAGHQKKSALFTQLNLFELAGQEFDKAFQMADSTTDAFTFDLAGITYAEQLYELGDVERSKSFLLQMIQSDNLDSTLLVFAYFHLAGCYEIAHDFENARTAYSKVSELVDQMPEWHQGDYFKALSMPQRATMEARLGNFDIAHELLADTLLHSQKAVNPNMALDFHAQSALVNVIQGNYAEAVPHFRKAVELNEQRLTNFSVEMFRIGFFKQTSEFYQNLIDCYYAQYKNAPDSALVESIFNTLQLTSGRTLQHIAKTKKRNKLPENYIMIRDSLQYLQRRLRDSVWKDDDAMTAELRMQHDIARNALLNEQIQLMDPIKNPDAGFVPLEKLQMICRQYNTNVIFFNISDTSSFSLVVQPEQLVVVPLDITPNDLEHKIQTLLFPLHSAAPKNLHAVEFRADLAFELYNDLFRPMIDKLDLAEHLFIIPGTTLLNVPFELLLTTQQPQHVYTTIDSAEYSNDFLLHRHIFTYSPSLMPLLNFDTHADSKSLIIFSNPKFYDENIMAALTDFRSGFRSIFERLPFSLLEGNAIENVYHAAHKSNEQVTKKTVINGLYNYDIVHIATHAFVDSVFESFSGLALATENEHDDGLLMGYRLQGESFDNDLIVLSACESGAGQFVAGEGVLGLPRLMLRAGAKSVLMSLWKVHDAFPAELMPTFYDHYLNNTANKSEALALAKRHVLEHAQMGQFNYKHPFFWATFCLYGSPGFESSRNTAPLYIAGIGAALLIIAALFVWRRSRRAKSGIE